MNFHPNALVVTALLFISTTIQAAESPVNGTLLSEGEQCFTMFRETPTGEIRIGNTWQSVIATELYSGPAWKIVVHQRGVNGSFDMRDQFLLHRNDLRPISLKSVAKRNGELIHEVELIYSDSAVVGKKHVPGGEPIIIERSFDQPVWDGNLWGLTFASLPLEEGKHYEIPAFQYDKGESTFIVDVVGTENKKMDGGEFDVVVMKGGMKGSDQVEYLIRQSPRAEIGYRRDGFNQELGGDCSGIR